MCALSDRSDIRSPVSEPARPSGGSGTTAVRAAFLLVAESGVLYLALGRPWGMWALGAHVALVVASGPWLGRWTGAADPRSGWLLWIMTAFTGPVGAGGVLLQLVLTPLLARSVPPRDEWYARLFPEPVPTPAETLHARLLRTADEIRRSAGPAAFVDVMVSGSREQKQALLTLLGRDYRPAFAPALRHALQDPHSAVRVQAAATIAQIEDEHLRRIVGLEGELAARPSDTDRKRRLANLHETFADLGLPGEPRAAEARRTALALHREILQVRPEDDEARLAIGRLLVRTDRFEEAAAWIQAALARGRPTPRLLMVCLEGLYRLRRIAELRALVERYGDDLARAADLSVAERRVLAFWCGAAGAPAPGEAPP